MSINELNFKERSLLFANLSSIAYNNIKEAKGQVKKLGFTTVEFYEKDGAQAYRFMNKTDIVIACRGTQPTEFNDIKADLKATPVIAETISRVHRGFKDEVDELWPMVQEDILRKTNLNKTLWFCGHSLGAAKAIMDAGALSVRAYITHGVLSGEACQKVEKSVLEELVVTDSIANRCPKNCKKTRQVSVAPLFGEAMRRVTNEESVSSLFV